MLYSALQSSTGNECPGKYGMQYCRNSEECCEVRECLNGKELVEKECRPEGQCENYGAERLVCPDDEPPETERPEIEGKVDHTAMSLLLHCVKSFVKFMTNGDNLMIPLF